MVPHARPMSRHHGILTLPHHPSGEPVAGNPYRIRNPQAAALTEIWLVSAVVSILVIRGYLEFAGYPQVGGDTLHIAHMLWGGLGMVVGFGMLIIFEHAVWRPIAAVVGGAGFGTFIDELGKFITQDNNYFYRPAIAIIYAIFVVLFLVARYVETKREPTSADHLYFAAEGVQWAAIGKLDRHRQQLALENLDASGITSPFADEMREMLTSADLVEQSEQSRILSFRQRMVDRYWKVIRNDWLERIVIGLFIFKTIQIFGSLAIGIATDSFTVDDGLSMSEWGATASTVIGGGLAVWGVIRLLQGARVAALHAFAASILLSLVFGQFFAFASDQFWAFGNLIIELIILGVLRFAISAESDKHHDHGQPDGERDPGAGIGQLF